MYLDIGYSLEQIKEQQGYDEILNCLTSLAKDEETKEKVTSIINTGKYGDFKFSCPSHNRDNPYLELRRRIGMAYILVRNPEAFDAIVEDKVNLFHGTTGNALFKIIKYGLNSLKASEEAGIEVETGERWSRIEGHPRSFVSFTDIIDVAELYSGKDGEGQDDMSFPVLIGTNEEEAKKCGTLIVHSDVPEVGIKNKLEVDGIKLIGVPSSKVDFVKKAVGNLPIKVVGIDTHDKIYNLGYDGCGRINITDDRFKKKEEPLYDETSLKTMSFKRILERLKDSISSITGRREGLNNGQNRTR